MTAPASAAAAAPAAAGPQVTGPRVVVRGREIPVVLPKRGDPRLRLSAVIMTLQVLGQTVLDFKLSIAQILVSIGVCAMIDLAVTYRQKGILAWPASGILTGNSVAFILRASGTAHGDWWSLNGIEFFVLAAVLSMAAKHLVRVNGRHVFNPSNVGIVWTLLVIGPTHVFPQYLWWGPIGVGVGAAFAVILVGGWWVLRSVRMIPMTLAFFAPFAALVGLLAASGRSFIAIWHEGPISGLSYWANIALSPEVMIFVFFMMSDPQTAPRSLRGRLAYGAGTAVLAAALLSFQPTEFGIKVAILASLTVTTALVPLGQWLARRRQAAAETSRPRIPWHRRRVPALSPAVMAAVIIAVAAPIDASTFAGNEDLVNIERGLTGPANAQ